MILLTNQLGLAPIKVEEADQVHPLMTACYPPVYSHLWKDGGVWYLQETYNPQRVIEDLQMPASAYYWVLWDKEKIGILRLQFEASSPDFPARPALKLQRIYLHPKTHSRGIGRSIIQFVVDEAIARQKHMIWLEVIATQISAQRFYQKVGFQPTGTLELPFEGIYLPHRQMFRMTRMTIPS